MAHRVAPQAEAELDDVWYYVATKSGSIEIADRLIDSITERFLVLARNPRVGRRRDEELRPGLRSFPVGEYIILYRIEDEDVLILHVVRGSRDIKALLASQELAWFPWNTAKCEAPHKAYGTGSTSPEPSLILVPLTELRYRYLTWAVSTDTDGFGRFSRSSSSSACSGSATSSIRMRS